MPLLLEGMGECGLLVMAHWTQRSHDRMPMMPPQQQPSRHSSRGRRRFWDSTIQAQPNSKYMYATFCGVCTKGCTPSTQPVVGCVATLDTIF